MSPTPSYETLVIVIILLVVLIFILISIIACQSPKFCQKTENPQEQRQSESSFNANVFYINSVCLPTEANVGISIENRRAEISNRTSESSQNLHVALDMPPSYSVLFGN